MCFWLPENDCARRILKAIPRCDDFRNLNKKLFSLFPLFSQAGISINWHETGKCRKKLGGYLGVNGRQKWLLVDTVDKSMILTISNIHKGFREIVAFSRLVKNPPARTGSQEVASSILASSTNKINNLQKIPNLKKVTNR